MKYLKLFERFEDPEFCEKIREFWKIDPYDFKDIIVSCLDVVDLYLPFEIYFSVLYREDCCSIFIMDEFRNIKPGSYFDNFESLLESVKKDFAFELFIYDVEESNEENNFIFDEKLSNFQKDLTQMLESFGVRCTVTEDWISDRTICFFIKIEKQQ